MTSQIPLTFTLTAPLHHGAGSSGNTSLLRVQDITLPDGTAAQVPFVSGNSLRNRLRVALAEHAVRILEIEPGSLTKQVVDLLWSGGAITRSGAEVDLATAREASELFPALRLFGYSAGSDMVASVLRCDMVHLVCAENTWRLPPSCADHPHARLGEAVFRDEEFGTRHDIQSTPADRFVALTMGESLGMAKSTQMIYDHQVLKPGAVMFSRLHLTGLATDSQRDALTVAIDEFAPLVDGQRTCQLAAKTAVGFGNATLDVDLDAAGARTSYETHLRTHRDAIIAVWQKLVEG